MPTLIDTLITKLSFQSDTSGLVAAEKAMERFTKKTNAANVAMGNLNKFLGFLGVSLGIGKMMSYANEWGKINAKLTSTGLSGNALTATFDQLKVVSKNTGTFLLKNAELYQRISQFMGETVAPKDMITAIDTLGKSAKVYGVSAEDAERGTEALSKALQSPIVEFRMLESAMRESHNIGMILEDHFKSLGTTAKKALSKGISSKELLKIFVAANAKMSRSFSETTFALIQAKENLHTSLSDFSGTFRDKAGLTDVLIFGMKKLEAVFEKFTKSLEENETEVKAFGGAILTFLTLLSIRLGIISVAMLVPFIKLAAGIAVVTLAIQDLYVFLTGGSSAIERFLRWVGLSDEAINLIRNTINGFLTSLKELINTIAESKTAVIALVSALGLLGTAWAVGKAMRFAGALGSVADAALDAAAATGKLGKKTPKLGNKATKTKPNLGRTGIGKVGVGTKVLRAVPTAIGVAQKATGIGVAAYAGWKVGELISNTAVGKTLSKPFVHMANKIMDANPRYNAKKIQESLQAKASVNEIQQRLFQNSNINNLTHANTTNAANTKYTDSSKNTVNVNIQNVTNPIQVQLQQAVENALGSIKQQYKASVLANDSSILR